VAGDTTTQREERHDAELAVRHDLLRRAINGVTIVLCLLAAAVPLTVLRWIVEPFAGKDTNVDVNLAITVAVTVSIAVNVLLAVKNRAQANTIKRLRARIDGLEGRLGT